MKAPNSAELNFWESLLGPSRLFEMRRQWYQAAVDAKKTTNAWQLLLLGLPVAILMLVSVAATGYISVRLVELGIREHRVGHLILGSLLGAMWLLMLYKTAKSRSAQT